MSILIKGMKLTDCWNCPCLDGEYGECNILGKTIKSDNGRRADCPLVEMPDHGDLIDRDVVVARLADWSKRLIETYGENDEYVNCLSEVLEGLGCEDVVIPAERSEE